MKLDLNEKQVGLVNFALQILIDDETTAKADLKSLLAIQKQIESKCGIAS